MTENEKEILDSTNKTDTTENGEIELDLESDEEIQEGEETITIPKKKWDTINAQKSHWKTKATQKTTETKKVEVESEKKTGLSDSDLIAIVRADVHDDDIDTVKKFATMEGLNVQSALKNDDLKAILEKRAEKRKTAEVTNTNTSRRTTKQASDEQIVENASKGVIPDKGSDDAERLFWARRGGKR